MPVYRPSAEDMLLLRAKALADPRWWARTYLGVELWSKQVEIVKSVLSHKETAVKSCHGAGKSFVAAIATLLFSTNHYPSLTVTTAPTDRQVKQVIWKEIRALCARARVALGGELLTQEIRFSDKQYALGFTSKEYNQNAFNGLHAEHQLVIVDEACGVSSVIHDGVDGLLSTGDSHKLEIGNPVDPMTPFAKSFTRPGVNKITITAYDTPNFKVFGVTEEDIIQGTWEDKVAGCNMPFPGLTNPEYVHRMYKKHGLESPWYLARVKAVFPSAVKGTLIPLAWIESAEERIIRPSEPNELGVDIGCGGDPSVIAHRKGSRVKILDRSFSDDTMETTGWIIRHLKETGATSAKIDTIGIGMGVVHRGQELGHPFVPMNAGGRAVDPENFLNSRAEWFWGLRSRFETQEIDICGDEDLREQLSQLKWKPDSRGRVVIEPKDQMKKRIGRSPDEADAVALAFGNPTFVDDDVWVL